MPRSCPLKASAHPASKHAGSFLVISSHFCADARSAHHDPQCVLAFCRQPFQRFGKLFHAWSSSRRWTVSLQHLGDLLKSGDYWQGQLASHWPSLAAVSNASTWWCTSSIIFNHLHIKGKAELFWCHLQSSILCLCARHQAKWIEHPLWGAKNLGWDMGLLECRLFVDVKLNRHWGLSQDTWRDW